MGGTTAQQFGGQPATPATPPPRWGHRWASRASWVPDRQAGCHTSQASPRPPTSLVSPTATWVSVVRGGVCASVERPVFPTPQPAVSTADFSALYERCMASGLKVCVVFRHAAGLHVITISCSLPRATTTATTAEKRRRRHHHHQCVAEPPPL